MDEAMTPRILNLQVRPLGATELCAPDVHYVPVSDSRVVAFDANTLIAVEISKEQHAALTRPRESSHVRPGEPPAPEENPPHALLFSKYRPKFDLSPDITCRQLTLHLSDQCNLRCKYCWIRSQRDGSSSNDDTTSTTDGQVKNSSVAPVVPVVVKDAVMTRGTAVAALSMFPKDGRDIRLGFFGGEPLIQFDLLREITEMVEARAAREKSRAFFHVTTNATLITDRIAAFLADHCFSIIVSCDGPEDLHDAARGEGSYSAMMRGLNLLYDAGCSGRIVLRATWSDEPPNVAARLWTLNNICAGGLAAGVALEPVAGAAYGHTLDADIRRACSGFGDRARAGLTPRWQYLEKTLQRILWQQFRPSECGAGRGYYTVGATGLIYACHKQQNAEIGCISDGAARIDEAKRGRWLDNRFCARSECSLCWGRHVCGGSCRSESLEFCGGRIAQPHAGRCMLMRQIVAEALVLAAKLPRETLLRICPSPDLRNRG
jgi:uncharacterized protein